MPKKIKSKCCDYEVYKVRSNNRRNGKYYCMKCNKRVKIEKDLDTKEEEG